MECTFLKDTINRIFHSLRRLRDNFKLLQNFQWTQPFICLSDLGSEKVNSTIAASTIARAATNQPGQWYGSKLLNWVKIEVIPATVKLISNTKISVVKYIVSLWHACFHFEVALLKRLTIFPYIYISSFPSNILYLDYELQHTKCHYCSTIDSERVGNKYNIFHGAFSFSLSYFIHMSSHLSNIT